MSAKCNYKWIENVAPTLLFDSHLDKSVPVVNHLTKITKYSSTAC